MQDASARIDRVGKRGVSFKGDAGMIDLLQGGGLSFKAGGMKTKLAKKGSRKGEITGAKPGVTRQVQRVTLSENPHVSLLDSPGIMIPRVSHPLWGARLALCSLVRDVGIPPLAMVEALLLSASPLGRAEIVSKMLSAASNQFADKHGLHLDQPCLASDVVNRIASAGLPIEGSTESCVDSCEFPGLRASELLSEAAAERLGWSVGTVDSVRERGAQAVVDRFRKGLLGRHTLDSPSDDQLFEIEMRESEESSDVAFGR